MRNDAAPVDELLGRRPGGDRDLARARANREDAGITMELVGRAADLPLLGICLGHQALAAVHGGQIVRAPEPVHGKTSLIHHAATGIFEGLPEPFEATRYHSLVVERDSAAGTNSRSRAWTEDGVIMGLEHRDRPHFGVQFHPESYLCRHGMQLLAHFLHIAGVPLQRDWAESSSNEEPIRLS